jgi:cysteine desulfurase / selenocysteine lyase
MDIHALRQDFPILSRRIHDQPLVYLDNAATSHKPRQVIEAITNYYTHHNANVHRGVHTLSDESTDLYDQARRTIANFIHAAKPEELIFTKNTTEAINLVAFSWGSQNLQAGDEIIVTELEHHSNLLPWQRLCQQTGARLVICPVDGNGDLASDHLVSLVGDRTKLICLTQISNVLGTIVDVKHLAQAIRRSGSGAKILVDGAQSVPHQPVDVQALKVDFLVFSGHKMLGPMGIGCLYVKKELLDSMAPFFVGGGMISDVYEDHCTYADLPDRFDAGTPNVAGAVGLAAACDYLDQIGLESIQSHEQDLTAYGLNRLAELEAKNLLTLYGLRDPAHRAGILTFNLTGIHAHDTAQILDREFALAVRSGHHCNQLLTRKLGTPATVRASFYLYNTKAEIDLLIRGLHRVREIIR